MKYARDGLKIHLNPRYCLVVTPLLIGLTIYLLWGTSALGWLEQLIAKRSSITRADAGWLLVVCTSLSGMIAITCWVRHQTKRAYRKLIRKLKDGAQRKFEADHQLFIERLAHEMKNSLAVIATGVDGLEHLVTAGTTEAKYVENIDTHTQQLMSLFGDMRNLADVESCALDAETIEVEPLLTRVFHEVALLPGARNRQMKKVISQFGSFSRVQGNEAMLAVALRNLLDNALKYSHEDDTIELRAFKARGEVVIQVADTGPGIAKEDFPNVWKQLWRGERTRSIQGSGIGLALVRTIVQKHNGFINLESEPNIGTEFTIYLPV